MNTPLQVFRAVEDLRPAPRTTPALVLWLMFLLTLCGIGLLMWPVAGPEPRPNSPQVAGAAPVQAQAQAPGARVAQRAPQTQSK